MYQLEEDQEIETLHVYVYPEERRRPLTPADRERVGSIGAIFFLVCAIITLCLLPNMPSYTTQTISVPAHILPPTRLMVKTSILPTGTRTYPATVAQGALTLYNGSIITQQLPAGFILIGHDGTEIITSQAVIIPPGNPPTSYGTVTVSAHAVSPGAAGNIPAGDIDNIYGTSLFIKNVTPFTNGSDARTVTFATRADTDISLITARSKLEEQKMLIAYRTNELLVRPCEEETAQKALLLFVTWTCPFVRFSRPAGVAVLSSQLDGSQVLLQVRMAGKPQPVRLAGK